MTFSLTSQLRSLNVRDLRNLNANRANTAIFDDHAKQHHKRQTYTTADSITSIRMTISCPAETTFVATNF